MPVELSAAHRQLYDAMRDAASRTLLADSTLDRDLARVEHIVMLPLMAATNRAALLDPDTPLHVLGEQPTSGGTRHSGSS